uniref:Uncharacterized protein n=1 Tax=Anguilla anguilla TaxID=7936 RepID=A0A0E9PDN1_ANGAN
MLHASAMKKCLPPSRFPLLLHICHAEWFPVGDMVVRQRFH